MTKTDKKNLQNHNYEFELNRVLQNLHNKNFETQSTYRLTLTVQYMNREPRVRAENTDYTTALKLKFRIRTILKVKPR